MSHRPLPQDRKKAPPGARSPHGPPAPTREGASARSTIVPLGLAALVAILSHLGVLWNDFVLDDRWIVERLPALSELPLGRIVMSDRGLTYALHVLDWRLWGDWDRGYHLTNLVLHAIVTTQVTALALRLTRSPRAALLCGVLFGAHPVHVEAVASAANRKDMLAMAFGLSSILVGLGPRHPAVRYTAAFACLGCAFLCKEVVAVGLVPVLIATDFLRVPPGQPRASLVRRLAPGGLAMLAVGVFVVARWGDTLARCFSPSWIRDRVHPRMGSYPEVLATTLASVLESGRLLLFPLTLSADYAIPPAPSVFAPRAMAGAALVVAWLVGTVVARRHSVMFFAMLWVFSTWLPSSNAIPLTHFFIAERYLYAPSFGVCLLVATGIDGLLGWIGPRRRRAVLALSVLLVGCLMLRTAARVADWRDSEALWTSAIRAGQATVRVHNNLGTALQEQGKLEEAVASYRNAVRGSPGFVTAHKNLGAALALQGKTLEAIDSYREATGLDASDGEARASLGILLARANRPDEAIQQLRQAVQLGRGGTAVHFNLGNVYARRGRWTEAVEAYEQAIAHDRNFVDAYANLGNALVGLGRYGEAVHAYRESLKLSEDSDVLSNLALVLATCPDVKLRRVEEAVLLAERSLQVGESRPSRLAALAIAYREADRPSDAMDAAERAKQLAEARGEAQLVTRMNEFMRQLTAPKPR